MKGIDWTPGFSSKSLSFKSLWRAAHPMSNLHRDVKTIKNVAETGYTTKEKPDEPSPTQRQRQINAAAQELESGRRAPRSSRRLFTGGI